jgi:hypothetical protein
MLIGNKQTFAIECHHEPIPNDSRWVFGRMCLWCDGNPLGNIEEAACMLNVTEGFLQSLIQRLDALDDPALRQIGDRAAFDFLDHALYGDHERSSEQIVADATRFRKFDLLTNGGESFDNSKSFIIGDGDCLRILFVEYEPGPGQTYKSFASARINRSDFIAVVRTFLDWMENEKNATHAAPSRL